MACENCFTLRCVSQGELKTWRSCNRRRSWGFLDILLHMPTLASYLRLFINCRPPCGAAPGPTRNPLFPGRQLGNTYAGEVRKWKVCFIVCSYCCSFLDVLQIRPWTLPERRQPRTSRNVEDLNVLYLRLNRIMAIFQFVRSYAALLEPKNLSCIRWL